MYIFVYLVNWLVSRQTVHCIDAVIHYLVDVVVLVQLELSIRGKLNTCTIPT